MQPSFAWARSCLASAKYHASIDIVLECIDNLAKIKDEGAVKIAIIGCGNLGTSLARGLLRSKENDLQLRLCDRSMDKSASINAEFPDAKLFTTSDPREAALDADVVVIAVKPKDVQTTVQYMRDSLRADALLVSCASGIEVATIDSALGKQAAVARAMPNTAVSVGAGTTGIFLSENCENARDQVRLKRVFGALSGVRVVDHEEALHAVTALSGSGPAFVLVMMEAMIEAGVRAGLSRKEAEFFAKGAFKAAHALVEHSHLPPADLRAHITSPAGTTAEGLYWLEKGHFRATIMQAIDETVMRSEELASPGFMR